MAIATLSLIDITTQLIECIGTALKAADHPADANGVKNRWDGDVCILPGSQVAFDSCCDGHGQAWVVLQNGWLTDSYPRADSGVPAPCKNDSVAQTIEVGVLRCVGTLECDCACKEQSALDVMIDFQALLQGVLCCFWDQQEDTCGSVEGIKWRFIGPEGGCAGSAITFTVQADTPCCPTT
jgi:hypothetical protein